MMAVMTLSMFFRNDLKKLNYMCQLLYKLRERERQRQRQRQRERERERAVIMTKNSMKVISCCFGHIFKYLVI